MPLPSQAWHGTIPEPPQTSQRARPPPDCHSPPLPPHPPQAVVPSPPHSEHSIPCHAPLFAVRRLSADTLDHDVHPARPHRHLIGIVAFEITGLTRTRDPALTEADADVN